MEGLSKRQQKVVAKLAKLEELSAAAKGRSTSFEKPGAATKPKSKLSYVKHVVIVLLIAAAAIWLKSGEGWYNELASMAETLDFDPYTVLSVPKSATTSAIKQQYRRLSLEWHPDKRPNCDDECRQTFERINESYKILSNAGRRQLYDTTTKVAAKSTTAFSSDMHPFEYEFSPAVWDNIVKPSIEGKQLGMAPHISGVWVVMVGGSKTNSAITDSLLPIWSDLAAKFYGRVSFLRIDADAYPDFESRMPFRIRVKPAFFMMSPVDTPLFFTDLSHLSPIALSQWITENMPNVLRRWTESDEELASYIKRETDDAQKDPRIAMAVISNKLPSTLIKALAIKTESTIEWIQPRTSRFMEFMGPGVQKQIGNIKDGAALVTFINGEPYARIIGPKAYSIDNFSRTKIDAENIQNSPAGKYLKFVGDLTRKVIAGNVVPGYRENYLYLCGANDDQKFCNVMKSNDSVAQSTRNWAQDHNVTLQAVYLPKSRKSSQLTRLMNNEDTKSVLMQIHQDKIAEVKADGSIGQWIPINNHHRFFPRYRKTNVELAFIWVYKHPLISAGSLIMAVSVYQGLKAAYRYLRSSRE